jgi:multiple sugar transport system ATP-binding protein
MREGKVQQVDAPQRLYEEPVNTFVAAFIGSPAMNLVEGTISGDTVTFGSFSIPLSRDRRPRGADHGRVIVGVRPEAFEDAAFATGDLPQIEVTAEVVEELGSDSHVFFPVDAEQVVIEDALSDSGEEEGGLLASEEDRTILVARVDSRTGARVGETIRLAVDPSRLYFFSPGSGESLLNGSAA